MTQSSSAWPVSGGSVGESLRAPGFFVPELGTTDQWPLRLRAALDIVLASPQRTFLFWGPNALFFYNDAIWRDYADVHDRIVGRPYREVFPDLWPVLGPLFQCAMAGETCSRKDLHAVARRDGTGEREVWVDLSMGPIRDATGAIVGALGFSLDQTDRKVGELRLQATADALREKTRALEIVNTAGASITGELDTARVAQTAVDAGIELSGAQFGAFFYNVIDQAGESYMLYAIGGVDRSEFEKFPMPRNTAVFAPTFEGEGIVRVDDITKDPRYGQNDPYRGMPAGHLPVRSYLAVPVKTPSGEVIGGLFYGHAEAGRFGEAAEASITSLAGQAALALDNARLFQAASREIERRTLVEEELRHLNETLEARVQEAIEERRRAEVALQQAQKMETIGKLTGGVAHDFNNLLQVVSGNLQLLAHDVAGNERAEKRITNALAGVSRGSKLASQLLAFGRRQPLEPRVLNLGKFLNGMDDMLRRALGEAIAVEVVTSGGLWNCQVDPTQLENAVLNLAINARDAMEGRGTLTIEAANVALDDDYVGHQDDLPPGHYVMLAVSDTGAGMAPEVMEQVFEPFFSTKAEGHGSGLGLSMVYGFVKQSGGHVKLYSEVGHGTTVKLYLPRVKRPEDVVVANREQSVHGGTETILVAEDDEDVRSTVVELLSDLGYRVLKANDAESALAVIESGAKIDLLFSDVVMPGTLKSPELARLARVRLPHLAVLFTSGYTENSIVHDGRLDEGVELLSKPYTREALARKIRSVLAKRAEIR